ncbi:NAD(P)H-dependent oxidoreductase [Ulvibacterium sp.]|uniref:NAD(P)H-dependent oxidoreductase n=1 Tax=Ulvibacterium sp. TaxID=2665914 RepID=UPI003CC67B7D
MKKLVILTHPNIAESIVNKAWKTMLEKNAEAFVVHALYEVYPDLKFDIAKEQEVLEAFDEIIFQFPIHWYSTPFALKKYIDEVFAYGWAFGPEGDRLKGKKIGFAVSTGGPEESYNAPTGISVKGLLNDLHLTFEYCGCEVTHLHVFYGAMFNYQNGLLEENAKSYFNIFANSN